MRNTIIITILLFAAVIGASIYYFSNLDSEKDGQIKPLTYLPQETFLITRIHNSAATDNIFKDYDIFEALIGRKEKQQWQNIKDSLLRNSAIQHYIGDGDIYISFHPTKDSIKTVFTIPTLEKINTSQASSIIKSLGQQYQVTESDTLGHTVYTFQHTDGSPSLHAVYHKSSFFASHTKALVLHVIDDTKAKIAKQHIDYFAQQNNRNSPLSTYFVHDQIAAIEQHMLRKNNGAFLALFQQLGGQSAWNLNFKSDALILSGESETSGKRENYLEIFGQQSKVSQSLYQLFPEHTSSYLSFSISDRTLFQNELNKLFSHRQESKKKEALAQTLKQDKDISLEGDIFTIFGNEFAIVEQSNQTELAFISLQDSVLLSKNISKFATETGDSVFRFEQADILYALYGDPFKTYNRPYFIIINNTLILSNSVNVLHAYKQDWSRINLLINSIGFKNFERIQGNEANITYFSRTRTSSRLISNLLKKSFSTIYQDNKNYGYQDFYSWSFQVSGNNGDFLSSVYGIYKSKTALGSSPEWTYTFKHRPITEPWVFEHSDTSQFILMQEQDHTVHGIHPSGKKLWSSVFHGRIVGQAQQLKDRSIVLLTDRSQLYRFSPDGKPLSGFSLKLPHEPSYSPTLATLNNEEILLIPAKDQLMAYDLQGKPVDNWRNITLDGKILFDIKVIDSQVFVGTENGHFYLFNSRGKLVKEETIQGSVFKNPIALAHNENQNPILLALDTTSTLFTFDFKQSPNKQKLRSLNNHALVDFGYLTNSNTASMIVLDGRNMGIYNLRDSLPSSEFTFTQSIDNRPQFFKNASGQHNLGVASRGNYLIYLFEDNGAIADGFPIEAFPNFYYGKIDYNSNNFLLCVRRDKKLYAFKN